MTVGCDAEPSQTLRDAPLPEGLDEADDSGAFVDADVDVVPDEESVPDTHDDLDALQEAFPGSFNRFGFCGCMRS